MALLYGPIWEEIKRSTWAEITVHPDRAATVIQGVKRTKSAENISRHLVGQVPYSRLIIRQERLSEHRLKVRFELLYDNRL